MNSGVFVLTKRMTINKNWRQSYIMKILSSLELLHGALKIQMLTIRYCKLLYFTVKDIKTNFVNFQTNLFYKNASQGRFHQHFCPTFFREQDKKLFCQMLFGKWRTDLANGTLIWQISPHIFGIFF